jgi:hypothetical protein
MVHLLLCRGQATQKTLSVRAVGQDSWRRGKPDRNYIVMINNFLLEGLTRTPIIGHVGIFISDPHNLFPLVVCVNLPSFPCVCFSRDFCTSIFYAFLSFPMKTTCQVCRNTLHFIILTGLGDLYKSQNSICKIQNSAFTSSVLDTHVFLSALFSGTCNLFTSWTARDHVSQIYKITGKNVVLCVDV